MTPSSKFSIQHDNGSNISGDSLQGAKNVQKKLADGSASLEALDSVIKITENDELGYESKPSELSVKVESGQRSGTNNRSSSIGKVSKAIAKQAHGETMARTFSQRRDTRRLTMRKTEKSKLKDLSKVYDPHIKVELTTKKLPKMMSFKDIVASVSNDTPAESAV